MKFIIIITLQLYFNGNVKSIIRNNKESVRDNVAEAEERILSETGKRKETRKEKQERDRSKNLKRLSPFKSYRER